MNSRSDLTMMFTLREARCTFATEECLTEKCWKDTAFAYRIISTTICTSSWDLTSQILTSNTATTSYRSSSIWKSMTVRKRAPSMFSHATSKFSIKSSTVKFWSSWKYLASTSRKTISQLWLRPDHCHLNTSVCKNWKAFMKNFLTHSPHVWRMTWQSCETRNNLRIWRSDSIWEWYIEPSRREYWLIKSNLSRLRCIYLNASWEATLWSFQCSGFMN